MVVAGSSSHLILKFRRKTLTKIAKSSKKQVHQKRQCISLRYPEEESKQNRHVISVHQVIIINILLLPKQYVSGYEQFIRCKYLKTNQ